MDENSIPLRQPSNLQKPPPPAAPLNVEISFHQEITRDESIRTPKLPYPMESNKDCEHEADAFGKAV